MRKITLAILILSVLLLGCKNKDYAEGDLSRLNDIQVAIENAGLMIERTSSIYNSTIAKEQSTYKTDDGSLIAIYIFDSEKLDEGKIELNNNINVNDGDILLKYNKDNFQIILIKANKTDFEVENKLATALNNL